MSLEKQSKFLELVDYTEDLQDRLNKARDELAVVMTELGMGSFVQNQTTGVVHQVVKPKGKFTYFADIDYVRTKKGDERSGTLSAKSAEEAGFVLKK